MAELVAAGAPELPEGYFYRIRPHGWGILRVTIRRQCRVGSRHVAEALAFPRIYANPRDAVVKGCQDAAEELRTREVRAARVVAARRYIGDHDPRGGR
ncbi:hypothetical protein ACIQH0_28245 [Streptomyces griseus]|uniref:hypothetical protein n=1 Tax=Streptomyces griseus TaxID=1911 RepID=UPI0038120499